MRGGAIYLPRQQPWYQPVANDISNFLWQLAGLKVRSNLEAQQAEIEEKRALAKEEREFGRARQLQAEKGAMDIQKTVLGKIGDVRTMKIGDEIITEEYQSTGWKEVGRAPRYKPETTINMNVDMSKKTQADLEEKIVQADDVIQMLGRVKELYRPEFLQYRGKIQAGAENILSRLGMSEADFARERTKWALEVDKHTLLWRKFITGVAGSPQEMETIEKTTLNTKYDSPAQFEAKLEYMPILAEAAKNRAEYILSRGFKDPATAPIGIKREAARRYPYPKPEKVDIVSGRYEKGQIYEDADGNQMKYLGNGKWGKP